MKVAIMQPTFLPWIGYFGLMDSVDHFVFLDHVQFARRSWQQRNRIKTNNGELWLSLPVTADRDTPINAATVGGDTSKIVKSIEHNYSKSRYWDNHGPAIKDIFGKNYKMLRSVNMHLIEYFIGALGITTKLSASSSMGAKGRKADMLADICLRLGAVEYISPPGSRGYLEESDAFEKAGIPVSFFSYTHPQYRQLHGEFVPYMCILDLLFNEGPESLKIIRSGYAGSHTGPGRIETDSGQEHQAVSWTTDHGLHDSGRDKIGAVL
jgi:hypothetical protein